ncbi:hypothetical protein BDN70DRAFT_923396 [Pholiota conissans]|uniref:F-box domain-containing protein n=1 Tax=Pholiota conissans TaxID=109636 RepID=A0A9P6CY39_9AGAR|nr:hypothetical protein BDN70DRAFT_923396 [Pholiota conissans]
MTDSLLSLPEDLCIRILVNLDGRSLVRCAMYHIQLYLDGLKDAGMSTATTHDRMGDLLRHRQAWFTQKWSGFVNALGPSYQEISTRKLGEGVIAQTDEDGNHLEIIWLSTDSSAEGRVIEHNLNFGTSEFCIDTSQDVFAFIERISSAYPDDEDIGDYEIDTNTHHPLARRSALYCSDDNMFNNPKLQISDNILVLWTSQHRPRVLIWNWKTGKLLQDTRIYGSRYSVKLGYIYDFDFLGTANFAFITCPTGCGSIDLYNGRIYLARLNLPPLTQDATLDRLFIKAYPNATYAHPTPRNQFIVNLEEQIHLFELFYEVSRENNHQHYVSLTMHGTGIDKPAVTVPWEDWGPANTTINETTRSGIVRMIRPAYGQRVVSEYIPPDINFEPLKRVEIKDFTLSAVLAADGIQTTFCMGQDKPSGVLVKSKTIRSPIFGHDVVGRLPYVSYLPELRLDVRAYSMIAMCEEGVVAVTPFRYEIEVFYFTTCRTLFDLRLTGNVGPQVDRTTLYSRERGEIQDDEKGFGNVREDMPCRKPHQAYNVSCKGGSVRVANGVFTGWWALKARMEKNVFDNKLERQNDYKLPTYLAS